MNKLLTWHKASNRWKHIAGGAAIGMLADTPGCALLAGGAAAGSLELKDRQWGGQWDWIDFSLTLVGAAIGQTVRWIIAP